MDAVNEAYFKKFFIEEHFLHQLTEVDENFKPTGKTRLVRIPINYN